MRQVSVRVEWRELHDEYQRHDLWVDCETAKSLYFILDKHGYKPKVFSKWGEDITRSDMRGWGLE